MLVESPQSNVLGMIFIFISSTAYTSSVTLVDKFCHNATQYMFMRFLVQLTVALIWWNFFYPESVKHKKWYAPENWVWPWLRGTLMYFAIFLWWTGSSLMSLVDSNVIAYTSPIITAFLAKIFLNEPMPKLWILNTAFALISLLLICQPSVIFGGAADSINALGFFVVFMASVFWSVANISVRKSLDVHFLQSEIINGLQACFVWTPIVLIVNQYGIESKEVGYFLNWSFSSATQVSVMICNGLFGCISLMCNVIGYQYGEATKVAWIEYTALILTTVYQIAIFSEIPNVYSWIGVFIMFATCGIPLLEEMYEHYKQHGDLEILSGENFITAITSTPYPSVIPSEMERGELMSLMSHQTSPGPTAQSNEA